MINPKGSLAFTQSLFVCFMDVFNKDVAHMQSDLVYLFTSFLLISLFKGLYPL